MAGVVAAALAFGAYKLSNTDILRDFGEDMALGHVGLQLALGGFCLNAGLLEDLANKEDKKAFDSHQQDMATTDFDTDGNINEDDYTKQSIYSILYAVYGDVGDIRFHGEAYQFRFNTWGVGGVYNADGSKKGRPDQSVCRDNICNGVNNLKGYPATTVQRHGKTAYAGLLNFETVKKFMADIEAEGRMVQIVEIGSGTGAGANELTWLHPNVKYTAVDMQLRGTKSCRSLHASSESRFTADLDMVKNGGKAYPTLSADTRLTCLHANGQELDKHIPDGFADIVLISETHIADVVPLDQETKNVFRQMHRILKKGGLFVWGNAIPTSIWYNSFHFLQVDLGMTREEVHDVTDNAVDARDEDFSRVEHFVLSARNNYYGLQFSERCYKAVNRLLLNFYRHPGTALYKRMLVNSNTTAMEKENRKDWDWCTEYDVPTSLCTDNRIDSYVHMAYRK